MITYFSKMPRGLIQIFSFLFSLELADKKKNGQKRRLFSLFNLHFLFEKKNHSHDSRLPQIETTLKQKK